MACAAIEHLLLRFRPLNRALCRAVERQEGLAARLARPDVAPLCITDDQVSALLGDVDELLRQAPQANAGAAPLAAEEAAAQEELRRHAAAWGLDLPLDALAQAPGLDAFEQEALLLCAAPEIDRSYERIYAYVLDDLNRRFPCVEMLAALTAAGPAERLERRRALSELGRLRRCGLLEPCGDAPTGLRQELRLGSGVLNFLLGGAGGARGLFRDREEVPLAGASPPLPELDGEARRLGRALAAGQVSVLGLWGASPGAADEVALAVAWATGRPLRRLRSGELRRPGADPDQGVREAVRRAVALESILWVATDLLAEPEAEAAGAALVEELAACELPVLLTGRRPWRPTALLAARAYAELHLASPGYGARKQAWARALSELNEERAEDLAARFRLSAAEVGAVARTARTAARLAGNGHPSPVVDQLEAACAAVTHRRSQLFATLVRPQRRPEDLVLPAPLHCQVLEIARFFRAWPRVAEEWGLGRLAAGGGMKALLTGDSGTGKTLAAEVIAGELGLALVKVDLARVVSKWVGETEKNLASAFDEAEESHAVLFFDEADALFGSRGEVHHGTDRYANLEVSYLLQRLEAYGGLAILASNLKDHIDAAFSRRFQVALHFPRPGEAERQRLWEIALPASAPLTPEVDRAALARLDLTGGGIVGAARTAALLAAGDGGVITMAHLVRAVARQFRREDRLLTPVELGPYAHLAQEE